MAWLGKGSRWFATLLIVAGGLFFLLLGLGAWLQLVEAREVRATGALAEATVTGKRAGGKRSSRHDFSYTVRVGQRQFDRTVTGIGYRDYERLQVGERILVWYRAEDPARSLSEVELAELESWPNRLFLPLAGLALLAWGVARMIRRPRAGPAPRN